MADITKGTAFPAVNADSLLIGSVAVPAGITNLPINATAFDRMPKVCVINFTGTQLHAGVRSWANPESADILVGPVLINVAGNTASTGTLSVGVHTIATTLSCTIIDNTSCNTTTVLNSIDHKGTAGAFARKVASGSYVTFAEATGNAALALNTANCQIYYTLI